MTEVRVGRLLAACLHQAIAEELENRLEFFEHWLRSDKLLSGDVGLAAIRAVAGFLLTEVPAYQRVMERAGDLEAEWNMELIPGFRRRLIGLLPFGLKARAAIRVATSLVGSTFSGTRAVARVRRGEVRLDVTSSVFCEVRERHAEPLCGFYLALTVGTLRRCGIVSHGRVADCHAVGTGETCTVEIVLDGLVTAADPAIAA
jgi:bacteriochlorophyll 4-vinyl reductase